MRVSSKEFVRSFASLSDVALRGPLVITKNGRDRLVLVSKEEYERMGGVLPEKPETVLHKAISPNFKSIS